ncbi:MAG: T9SS type A sorting domain-containing protein [Bacteroidota bacterium]
MKIILLNIITCLLILISYPAYTQSSYNWRGGTSSDWSNPANWRIGSASTAPATPPTSIDNVFIGINGLAFTNQPQINTGYTPTVASVTLGAVKVVNLTVNGTLTVNGDITQRHNNSGGSIAPTIGGTGTISCNNLWVGDNITTLAAPTLGLFTQTFNTILTTTVANLNITNNLNLSSNSSSALLLIIVPITAYNVANPYFYQDGGTLSIGNAIVTSNVNYLSSGTTQNLSGFFITANTAASVLYLNGATPLSLDANGAGSIDFYRSGTFQSTVVYNYAGAGIQTVYTSSQSKFDLTPSSYQNLQFASAGVKSIQSGNLTVSADWTSAGGKVDAVTNNPTVIFQGSTQSLTDGGSDSPNGMTFNNVTVTGGGTKTITSGKFNVATTGILTMASSSTLNANGNLTLFSDATSSAAVAVIPSGSSITNNVNVQRYLSGGNTKVSGVYTARGYRMLSSPVNYNGTAYLSLNYIGNTALTGGSGTGFTVTNNNPTLYLFREDVPPSNTTFNSGRHKGILSINSDNTVNVFGSGNLQVPVGNGYIFYFVGNTSNPTSKTVPPITAGPENTVITATGRLNQGDIPVNLWYTPAGASSPVTNKLSYQSSLGTLAGYNMVGNPYASTLDLNKVIADNPTLSNTVYELYNVNPGQKYVAYNKGGSSDPKANQYVVSGQGFIVQAKAANATLTFHESEKVPAQQLVAPTLLMGMPVVTENKITGFYIKLERDSLIDDFCGIYFSANTSANYDADDAQDLDGASSQVYMSSFTADGVRTAINRLPDYKKGAEIRLYTNATASGLYKLKIEDIRNIDPLYDIWLKDKFKNDSLDFRRYKVYNFNIDRSDTSTFGAYRFKLVIRRRPSPAYRLVSLSAVKVNDGVNVTWKTENEGNFTGFGLGKLKTGDTSYYSGIYAVQSDGTGTYSFIDKFPVNGANTYRLSQSDIDNVITFSNPVSVQFNPADTNNIFSIYPNPARENITVNFSSAKKGTNYTARVYNSNGVLQLQKSMQNGNWSQYVGQLMPGTYILELSTNKGEYIDRAKFIKN